MLELAVAAAVVAANPTPDPGLPIKGVTVDRKMPQDVTHIESPPLRSYKAPAEPATPSSSPAAAPRHR